MTELPIDENTPRILIVEDEPKLGQWLDAVPGNSSFF